MCVVTLAIAGLPAFGEVVGPPDSETPAVTFSDTVHFGILFIDGQYLPKPYLIEATAQVVTVNGIPYAAVPRPGDEEMDSEEDFTDRPAAENSGPSRRRRSGAGGGRRVHPARVATVHAARDLVDALLMDSIVVAFGNEPVRVLSTPSDEFVVFGAVLAGNPTDEQIHEFVNLMGGPESRESWTRWVREFRPDAAVRAHMEKRIQLITETEAASQSQVNAVLRLEKFAYPLTVIGMLLGVIALGHMLKWTGRGLASETGDDRSEESVRYAGTALLLMLGMSAVDLVWTILAGQAGLMREMNPLAAGMIDSPAKLATFKVLATSVGIGILYVWRQRRQIQQATWWMCLVSVLLTFRWVMFDSLTS